MKDCEKIQMGFYESADSGATVLPVSYTEWEERAKEKLAAGPFGYVNGAAGAGDTMKANVDAFKQYRIRPRICRDISKRSLDISLFGSKYPVPFLFAPIGVNSIVHADAEVAPAKSAASLGIPYILSNVSTTPMEKVAEAMGDAPRWFQLYPPVNQDLTKSFLNRAEKAGFSAIVVTIDSTLLGWRETDLRNSFLPFLTGEGMGNYFTDPVFLSMLDEPPEQNLQAACKKALSEGNNTGFSWKDLEFIKKETKLPVLLKGLTHPDDALLAVEHGADGIIVSNHGGRQLDGAIATLEALPSVCEAVEHKVPVLMDSGIRRGADIIKALALGASAVLVGRPYIYGLAVAGETGVKAVMENLIAETELQMAICGRKSISEIDKSLVVKV
ncbi:alpha-hydroxy-acid oxidizing protein [Fredinandcohnia sp. QZ13]|nr:alpha-hydroxy-acid oxidizing protein [Fredinandcohnia sp. QZ13]MDR4889576.1 alpha-hydroxy-acid oxidizing protein [Fredinandcohnia sp. QZ13]